MVWVWMMVQEAHPAIQKSFGCHAKYLIVVRCFDISDMRTYHPTCFTPLECQMRRSLFHGKEVSVV
jgi:hypothetical protein